MTCEYCNKEYVDKQFLKYHIDFFHSVDELGK